MTACVHNHRCRYSNGFLCEDCHRFIDRASAEYRRDEELFNASMELHNLSIDGLDAERALALRDRIGVGIEHDDYEALLAEASALLSAHGRSFNTSVVVLKTSPDDAAREQLYAARRSADAPKTP